MAWGKQIGPCAFTGACTMPGPRVRLPGTNREFCPQHARDLALVTENGARGEPAVASVSLGRRRGGWISTVMMVSR